MENNNNVRNKAQSCFYVTMLQTLDLLYNMANPVNVRVICSKMLDQLTVTTEPEAKAYIVHRITDLTHRYIFYFDLCASITLNPFLLLTQLVERRGLWRLL